MKELNQLFNSNLDTILSRKGLSRTDLANIIGIDRTALFRRLQGNITLDTIYKVCCALNIEPHELFKQVRIKH